MVREVALVVRLSEDERASWHASARAAGWGKTAGWVRAVVAAAAAGRTGAGAASTSKSAAGTSQPAVDRQVLGELSAIGSNVNQLARAVNAAARGGQPLAVELSVVEALRVDVVRLIEAVTTASTRASSDAPTGTSSPGEQR